MCDVPPVPSSYRRPTEVQSVLTAGRAAVQKVRGHVSFPFDLDQATTLHLVALTVQDVVQISGHLNERTTNTGMLGETETVPHAIAHEVQQRAVQPHLLTIVIVSDGLFLYLRIFTFLYLYLHAPCLTDTTNNYD